MRILFALFCLILIATTSWAGLDPDADQIGIYFDLEGDVVCTQAAFANQVPIYLLYTNPTYSEIRGFECNFWFEGPSSPISLIATHDYPVYALNLDTASSGRFIVGYSEPVPTTEATVLVSITIIYLDTVPLEFYLGPAEPSSLGFGLPVILGADYSMKPVGLSAAVGPMAMINGVDCGVVATDQAAWDSIKAMYR